MHALYIYTSLNIPAFSPHKACQKSRLPSLRFEFDEFIPEVQILKDRRTIWSTSFLLMSTVLLGLTAADCGSLTFKSNIELTLYCIFK